MCKCENKETLTNSDVIWQGVHCGSKCKYMEENIAAIIVYMCACGKENLLLRTLKLRITLVNKILLVYIATLGRTHSTVNRYIQCTHAIATHNGLTDRDGEVQ